MRARGGLAALLPFAASLALAAPINDACDSATVVPDDAVNRYFDTLDLPTATIEPGEATGCAAPAIERSAWYRWTAPNDGELLVVTSCGATGYAVAANLWPGTCADTGELTGCITGECSMGPLGTEQVTAGTEYLVQVGTAVGTAVPTALIVQLCFLGPDQEDADEDALADCLDPCTDSDRDGFGDGPIDKRPFDTCPPDNCADLYNPDQADKDGDGVGDACDSDDPKEEKTLQEAAEDGEVELTSKACIIGDCVAITIRAPTDHGLIVVIREGDVILSRNELEQDLAITRPHRVFVPAGGVLTLGGLYSACLEQDHLEPDGGDLFDVADNLVTASPEQTSIAALHALLASDRGNTTEISLQFAVWAITDGGPSDSAEIQQLLVGAGLDPAALPAGGFPVLLNPNEGSTEARARYVPGLIAGGGGGSQDCPTTGTPEQLGTCLLNRLAALLDQLSPDAVKPKLRKKTSKAVNGIRAKILAAAAAGDDARRLAKLRRAAGKRADSLLGVLGRAATKQKIPADAAPAILDAATRLASALG